MSLQVKWELCPDATHYLPKTDRALGSFWRFRGEMPETRWDCQGVFEANSGLFIDEAARARLIANPAFLPSWGKAPEWASVLMRHVEKPGMLIWAQSTARGAVFERLDNCPHKAGGLMPEFFVVVSERPASPSWSKGPADASHWGPGCEQWLEAFYKFDGVDTYCVVRADLTRHWFQLDTPLPPDRIAQLIERPVAVQPVALPARSPLDLNSVHSHDWDQGYNDGWDALAEKMAKLGPLYTGPDAGEVARLSEVIEQQKSLIKSLRADLRESISIGAADAPQWDGQGRPPAGTDCIVTPHNTVWGFDEVREYECKALAYNGEYVWLSTGIDSFVITRTDKVDFAPIRTAASEARVAAAQAWLKGIEQDYGQEVADKCEDILMEAESRLRANKADGS